MEVHRQERLARMYDAPTRSAVQLPLPNTAQPVNPGEARRSARFYDSPDMQLVRDRAAKEAALAAQPSAPAKAPNPSSPDPTSGATPAPVASPASVQDRASALGIDPTATVAALLELGLTTPEQQAKAFGLVESRSKEAERAWRDQVSQWGATVERRYSPSDLAGARDLVKRFGDQDLIKAFDQLGIGNHPAVVRFVVHLSRAFQYRQGTQ